MHQELDTAHDDAATVLNDSMRHYEEAPNTLAREFLELKLQACIFQYDICTEMVGFVRNQPVGFAASVAMKGIVLRLYEYDDLMNSSIIPRLLRLAKTREIPFDSTSIKQARIQWKNELKRLRKWSDVRNQAAGHYGKDLNKQVALLKTLIPDEVLQVTAAFLEFNMCILGGLRDAGKDIAQAG
jgi:hypothetical protein